MRRRFRPLPLSAIVLLIAAATPGLAQSQPPRPNQPPPPQRGAQQPATAQQQPPAIPEKPYNVVTISAPPAVSDPGFEAFRKQVSDIAKRKDRAGLGKLIVAQGFFWMGEKGDKADKKKPGMDSLAKALDLAAKDGSGWETLDGYAADPTGTPLPDKKDVICGPADPVFDQKQFEDLMKSSGDDAEWGYPIQPGLEVRGGPQPNAPVIEKLGLNFVRVMQEDGPAGQPSPTLRVVTPSGKTGFVPAEAISPLGNDQLCYTKDAGSWKIAGFIGGE